MRGIFTAVMAAAGTGWLAAAVPLVAQEAPEPPPSRAPSGNLSGGAQPALDEVQLAALRLREGTKLRDAIGRFRQNGDTLVFVDSQDREITGLPNLNLERVARMLRTLEEPESVTWSVSGTITEFGGHNYVLLSRAVSKSISPPPPPEIVRPADILASPAPAGAATAPPPGAADAPPPTLPAANH